jgi:hypothetical protein
MLGMPPGGGNAMPILSVTGERLAPTGSPQLTQSTEASPRASQYAPRAKASREPQEERISGTLVWRVGEPTEPQFIVRLYQSAVPLPDISVESRDYLRVSGGTSTKNGQIESDETLVVPFLMI